MVALNQESQLNANLNEHYSFTGLRTNIIGCAEMMESEIHVYVEQFV